jgi:hypothetical protein
MFRAIAEDDLCIALLTFQNPNVYYELAVAHTLGRPVIILLLKGEPLPFDIADLRCVYYDLKPRPLHDGVYVDQLAAYVEELETSGWAGPGTLQTFATPDTPRNVQLIEHSEQLGTDAQWMQLVEDTTRHFDACSVSMRSWLHTPGFEDTLARKAETGCRVRILLADPSNPAFTQLSALEVDPSLRGHTVASIDEALARFRVLQQRCDKVEVRQMRQGIPHYQLTLTDELAVAIPYLHSIPPARSPMFNCTANSAAYQLLAQDFHELWILNTPPAVNWRRDRP